MDLREVDVLHVVGAVVVADLTACPVDAFDLDDFPIFDLAGEGDWKSWSMLVLVLLWGNWFTCRLDAICSVAC